MLKMLILFSILLSGCSSIGIVPRDSKDALPYASEVDSV